MTSNANSVALGAGGTDSDTGLTQLGASAFSKLELVLIKAKLFDFLQKRLRIVTKRPISLFARIPGGRPPLHCCFDVLTNRDVTERAVLNLKVQYFGFLGKKMDTAHMPEPQVLFADPASEVETQYCHFDPPKGAFWALVTLERRMNERRIAVKGSMKLRRYHVAAPLLDDALASRNIYELRQLLAEAELAKDRAVAKKLLARLIFLQQRKTDQQLLATLNDIDTVLRMLSAKIKPPIKNAVPYKYSRLLMPFYSGDYPLSKWIASESMMLEKASGGTSIVVEEGKQVMLRRLVLTVAGLPHDKTKAVAGENDVPWIDDTELTACLKSE